MATVELEKAPGLGRLYLQAAVPALRRRDALPEDTLVLSDVAVDRDHLAAYSNVCGFRLSGVLPPTYPHIVAFPLAVRLMAAPTFPFALPGLVHIANRIEQMRPISDGERLDVSVSTHDLRPHDKGRQFDVVASAEVEGETVWRERSTYLKREATAGAEDPARVKDPAPPAGPTAAVWRIPADTGRRYAAVSGDRNPIHLHPLTARALGFPRAIAHGMWTAARCVAALEGRVHERATIDVRFLKPVLLPATAIFSIQHDPDGVGFSLRNPRSAAPHLNGRISQ